MAARKAFSLLAVASCGAKSIMLIKRETLVMMVVMMMLMRGFFYDVGAFVLGASAQVDLGVLFVTLSVRSKSSSSYRKIA